MIYFDNAATTIPYQDVLKTYQDVAMKIFGNPSSLHVLGTQASRILEASRKQIAELLNCDSEEIFLHPVELKAITGQLKALHLRKRLMEIIF